MRQTTFGVLRTEGSYMENLNSEIKGYWEGEAEIYDDGIQEELNSSRADVWENLILQNIPQKEKLHILDVGTGPGFFPVILGRAGHRVTGIDISENMILHARENIKKYEAEAELMTMDSQNLEFPDCSFDAVICRNLTWTLDFPERAYREWTRVLKPGGALLVFDACWYLWMYDQEKKKVYLENEKKIREKYHRGIHMHADNSNDRILPEKLFMSDKQRPQWDLNCLISLGYGRVFAEPDISLLTRSAFDQELNWPTPEFMVGGIL